MLLRGRERGALRGLPRSTACPRCPPNLDAALFFSARSAAIFRDLATGARVDHIIAICISEAAAEALKPLRFKDVRVAAAPNQDAMLALLF